jgi:hypothetical protein
VFDFNPTTIKSILEEGNDDGELVFESNLRFFWKFLKKFYSGIFFGGIFLTKN